MNPFIVSFQTENIMKQFLGVGGELCYPPSPDLLFLILWLYGQFG